MPNIVTVSNKRGRKSKKPLMVLLGVALIAAVAALIVLRGKKETGGADVSVPVAPPAVQAENERRPADADEPALENVPGEDVPSAGTATNALAELPQTNRYTVLRLKRQEKVSGMNGGVAEQVIALAVGTDDITGMPPLPIGSEESFRKELMVALSNDIVIYEDDDPKTVAMKERVAEVKLQLAKVLEEGGSVTDALREYQEWINQNRAIRSRVTAEYRRIKRQKSPEEAEAYLRVANEELAKEGIIPVTKSAVRRPYGPSVKHEEGKQE